MARRARDRALGASTHLLLLAGCFLGVAACGRISEDDGSGGTATDAGSGGSPPMLDLPECAPLPGENSGASSGAHTIRGTVLDAAGVPLVNVPIELGGDATARHFTNLLGTYTLRADPGDYTLSLGDDACTIDPNEIDAALDSTNVTHDGVSTGGSCTTGKLESPNGRDRLVYIDDPGLASDGAEYDWRTTISISKSPAHEDALETLREAAANPAFEMPCSLVRGAFVGFEGRTFFTTESDFFTYTNRVLATRFVLGDFTISISTSLDEYATEEEMQRALVPVRNISEEDLDALLQGL